MNHVHYIDNQINSNFLSILLHVMNNFVFLSTTSQNQFYEVYNFDLTKTSTSCIGFFESLPIISSSQKLLASIIQPWTMYALIACATTLHSQIHKIA